MEAIILIVPAAFILGSLLLTAYGIKKMRDERKTSGPTKAKTTKDRLVINCEKCQKKLRVPKGGGKLKVTCPSCKHSFAHQA